MDFDMKEKYKFRKKYFHEEDCDCNECAFLNAQFESEFLDEHDH